VRITDRLPDASTISERAVANIAKPNANKAHGAEVRFSRRKYFDEILFGEHFLTDAYEPPRSSSPWQFRIMPMVPEARPMWTR
jgi:hypothetical protein